MILLDEIARESSNNKTFNDAKDQIKSIADNVTRFKIGKTGQELQERLSGEYKTLYDKIVQVGHSPDSDLIDQWKKKLIAHFKNDENYKDKCDNEAEGGGAMEHADIYRIYVVTKI